MRHSPAGRVGKRAATAAPWTSPRRRIDISRTHAANRDPGRPPRATCPEHRYEWSGSLLIGGVTASSGVGTTAAARAATRLQQLVGNASTLRFAKARREAKKEDRPGGHRKPPLSPSIDPPPARGAAERCEQPQGRLLRQGTGFMPLDRRRIERDCFIYRKTSLPLSSNTSAAVRWR